VIELATENLMIPDKFRQRYLSVKDMKVNGASPSSSIRA
jgi:hypothetical protein